MCQCHTDDVSPFIQSIFDFTSDLHGLPRTYTFYLGQYGIHLRQYGLHLGQYDTCFPNLGNRDQRWKRQAPRSHGLVDL